MCVQKGHSHPYFNAHGAGLSLLCAKQFGEGIAKQETPSVQCKDCSQEAKACLLYCCCVLGQHTCAYQYLNGQGPLSLSSAANVFLRDVGHRTD